MKVSVYSLGCKVNQYEADAIARELGSRGIEVCDGLRPADLYLINTCAVTNEAERKSRQAIARVRKINPAARIVVCGCASENNPGQFIGKDGVIYVSGSAGKARIPDIIDAVIKGVDPEPCCAISGQPLDYEDNLSVSRTRTRGYIKIQDGCNNFCSYCLIPYLRGRSRSRSIASILNEALGMQKEVRELVLTGINISAYGVDIGSSLAELAAALGGIDARLRLGSLEVNVVDEELLAALKALKAFCPQFHLSLQSGDDETLRAMNRHYTADEYLNKVNLIRGYFPGAAITTDLICGFPTETEEQFDKTLAFIRRVGFADMHIFAYSCRDGTAAAGYKQLPYATIKERAARAEKAAAEMKREYLLSKLGEELESLIECDNSGYSREYVRVYAGGREGELIKVRPTELYMDGVR